jgi:acyl-CoA reductase-like NAD-dependent aldehyde dehydrogenase
MVNVNIQTTISPYTQHPICTRPLLSPAELDNVIGEAVKAQKVWRRVPLDERLAIAERWLVGRAVRTGATLTPALGRV